MATVTEPVVQKTLSPTMGTVAPPAPRSPWLVGPFFDLFFLANWFWPVLAVLVVFTAGGVTESQPTPNPVMQLFLLYLLSTPHRWITLPLVFLDKERFLERRPTYLGILLLAAAVIGAVWLSTGALALLLAIDYVWNAWHFAAQHSGIARIYARTARPDVRSTGLFEKTLLRVFILYTIFRLLGFPNVEGEDAAPWLTWLHWTVQQVQGLDLFMLALPASLMVLEFRDFRRSAVGRIAYLGSVCLIYSGLLLAAHFNEGNRTVLLVLGLGVAISVFHSTEYLAIVSWSVWKRHGRSKSGVFAHLVPRWGIALMTFMCALGISAMMIDKHFVRAWLVITIFVSYLHYAYDGMIWKVRRPASAAVS